MTAANRFLDHSANERTFLGWVRVALSILAIALVLEKLDVQKESSKADIRLLGATAVVGVLVLLGATLKYLRIRARIIAGEEPDHGIPLLDIALAFAIVVMFAALLATHFVA
ncbi:DUF202 domain-containing protein [Novosphingobium sp. ZN18A2]|uniref:DUF202 domain-containing protein n=1 Tax=Novosphingobium sp. ZN18A2 TaxID=3079861 RepID=UPI0030CF36E9